jgi:hypothetical protein
VREITDYPGLVQMAVQQDAAVQNAGQWLDGRSSQTYTIIFAERTFNTLGLWTMIKQDAAVTAHYAYTPI